METAQCIANEAGGGIAIAIVVIAIAVWIFKAAWPRTMSEDAQKRDIERGRKEKR